LLSAVYPADTALTSRTLQTMPMPAYLKPVIDPTFGTQITRVADQKAMDSPSPTLRHIYAKDEVWNSDGSLVALNYNYPCAILDGHTYKFLHWLHQPSEAVWANTDPYTMYGTFFDTNQFVKADVRTDWNHTVLATFTQYDTIDFGAGEGNLSANDQYVALFGLKGGQTSLFVYDIKNNQVVATLNLGGLTLDGGNGDINNATMSPNGDYVIVQYNHPGTGRYQGIEVFDRNLNFLRNVSARAGAHYDIGYDTSGNEVIVEQSDTDSSLIMRQLATGRTTTLLPASQLNDSIHISCRNLDRPGWAYISEFRQDATENSAAPNYQEVFAVRLDGSGTVELFANEQHSNSAAYDHEAMAVPSPDGSKVMFASDWGNATGPVYSYVAESPLTDQDIGAPPVSGSAAYSGPGAWTIHGGGAGVGGTSDQFGFDYRTLAGNGIIAARVVSVQNTNPAAQAGVMFRNGTDRAAAFIAVLVTPGGGISLRWRSVAGGPTMQTTFVGKTAPLLVEISRNGNTFTAYWSGKGKAWRRIGSAVTISMPTSLLAGLAVASGDAAAACTAVFDNLWIIGA
jgi:hypothetical protein